MINSKLKGANGEREASKYLRSLGFEARRSQQYQGVSDEALSADIIHNIPGVRVEVKRGYCQEELSGQEVATWVAKAREETPMDHSWIILWRKNHKKWMAIFNWYSNSDVVCMSADVEKVIKGLIRNV